MLYYSWLIFKTNIPANLFSLLVTYWELTKMTKTKILKWQKLKLFQIDLSNVTWRIFCRIISIFAMNFHKNNFSGQMIHENIRMHSTMNMSFFYHLDHKISRYWMSNLLLYMKKFKNFDFRVEKVKTKTKQKSSVAPRSVKFDQNFENRLWMPYRCVCLCWT